MGARSALSEKIPYNYMNSLTVTDLLVQPRSYRSDGHGVTRIGHHSHSHSFSLGLSNTCHFRCACNPCECVDIDCADC
eukprot:COSAG06_NODE_32154_length_510_cov_1.041363_2_plen_77_part_01